MFETMCILWHKLPEEATQTCGKISVDLIKFHVYAEEICQTINETHQFNVLCTRFYYYCIVFDATQIFWFPINFTSWLNLQNRADCSWWALIKRCLIFIHIFLTVSVYISGCLDAIAFAFNSSIFKRLVHAATICCRNDVILFVFIHKSFRLSPPHSLSVCIALRPRRH